MVGRLCYNKSSAQELNQEIKGVKMLLRYAKILFSMLKNLRRFLDSQESLMLLALNRQITSSVYAPPPR